MLGHRGIAAGDDHAKIGYLGPGGPDFLAIEDPVVAIAHRAQAHTGQVGAGGRLGEKLAPDFVAAQAGTQVALLLLGAAEAAQNRQRHAQADLEIDIGQAVVGFFLLVDHLLHGRAANAAELPRPGDLGKPALGLKSLPLATEG
ncbi:hypothetical protein D3C78_1225730 [compost metagenome]